MYIHAQLMRLQIQDNVHCVLQDPVIENACNTSPINGYMVQINYTRNNNPISNCSDTIPANSTSILMSNAFPDHLFPMTTYNITVFALNEGGRSEPSKIKTIGEYYMDVYTTCT